jgi:hypothetical protein
MRVARDVYQEHALANWTIPGMRVCAEEDTNMAIIAKTFLQSAEGL